MFEDELIHVGFVSKTHGFSGIFRINFLPVFRLSSPLKGFIFIAVHNKPVPFHILEVREYSESYILIRTEEITSKEQAAAFGGMKVLLKKKNLQRYLKEGWKELQLTGYLVVNQHHEEAGRVVAVEKTPAHYLLVLDNERLIPFHSDLIINIIEEEKTLIMNLPEGLD